MVTSYRSGSHILLCVYTGRYEMDIMDWACISYDKTTLLLYVLLLWEMEFRMSILFVISGNLIYMSNL